MSRKPTHKLVMKHKDGNSKSREVGAMWTQEGGDGMSLVLNMGVTISWRDSQDHWFNIWPVRRREPGEDTTADQSRQGPRGYDDDEIPF